MKSIVEVQDGWFRFPRSKEWILKGVDLTIPARSSVGVVGESGSGKSTLLRVVCGLLSLDRGTAKFEDQGISEWLATKPGSFRKRNQLVFQNPRSSFDPRMRLMRSLAEPVRAIERRTPSRLELEGLLKDVGLPPEVLGRYPHELSGGQLQRVALARAMSVGPDVIYADEPTSALDVSVQAKVLNLLMDMRAKTQLTLVTVSHDLAIVSRICERLVIMKDGCIVESGATVEILSSPTSEYTKQLVTAALATSLSGQVTSSGLLGPTPLTAGGSSPAN